MMEITVAIGKVFHTCCVPDTTFTVHWKRKPSGCFVLQCLPYLFESPGCCSPESDENSHASFDLVSSVSKTPCFSLGLPELNEHKVDDIHATIYLLLFDEL